MNSLSSASWTLAQDLALYEQLGVRRAGLYVDKLVAAGAERAVEAVRASGLLVDHVFVGGIPLYDPTVWAAEQRRLGEAVDLARALDSGQLTVSHGAPGALSWEAAADACEEALGPVIAAAADRGVRIGIEQTLPVRPEIGFAHSFAETVVLARRIGAVTLLEANYAFSERGIAASLRDAGHLLSLVQVSDLVPPSGVIPDRAVPGDGVIPLRRLIGQADAAGYQGPIELEMLGPRIEAEGYESACRRGVRYLSDLLAAMEGGEFSGGRRPGPGDGPSVVP